MKTVIKLITYPHYEDLPLYLKNALNLMRTDLFSPEVHECCYALLTIDENDLTFLNLDSLVDWVKVELPDFDVAFLKAAARLHKECYKDKIFSTFLIEEEDLFNGLLHIKDEYELKKKGE
jgi:hypothetical protein